MKLKKCVGIFLFSTLCLNVGAIDHKGITFDQLAPDRFTLMENGVANEILVDEQEDAGVMIAVRNLQNDFKRVSGRAAGLCYTPGVKRMIMVGTLKSRYIRELVKAKKIDASLLEGKNEKYLMTVVSAPLNGVDEALVIVGSDKRGTIYGIYELSEQIGVSPWYDWADVPVMSRQNLSMTRGSYTAGEPAVKYRGIFLNDEAPCLTGWVKHTYGTNYGDHRFYARVFELDASLTFEPESSLALGFGFRCGFLGLLHMEIIQERLYREFDMDVITTVPNVSYRITTTQGDVVEVHNPSGLPEVTKIAKIEEPYILAQIITKAEFLGNVIKLCIDKRGVMKNQTFITQDRVEVNFDMPLSEIVFDFYDKLKSISKGYASFDYHRTGYQPSKLVKLDILLNGEPVDALSSLTYTDHAYDFGRKMCEKLKELIPRQQFDIAIQAAIGAKIIARETVKAVRKDVTAKCYGGDISRKRKLLEKQKKGKKRMRQIGNVEVPQSAFLAVLKMD